MAKNDTIRKLAMSGLIAATAYLGLGCAPVQSVVRPIELIRNIPIEQTLRNQSTEVRVADRRYLENLITNDFNLQSITSERVDFTPIGSVSGRSFVMARDALVSEMQKYDVSIINEIGKVRVAYDFKVNNGNYLGTYRSSTGELYLGFSHVLSGTGIQTRIGLIFNIELAAVLFEKYFSDYDKWEWSQLNPPGFSYQPPGTTRRLVQQGGTGTGGVAIIGYNVLEDGFLSEYGTIEMVNDFKTTIGLYMNYPNRVLRLTEQYKTLGKKLDLAIQFYSRLTDGRMDENYFKNILPRTTRN